MATPNTIKCPNYATKIEIDKIFYHQIEEKFKAQYHAEQNRLQEEVEAKRKEYKKGNPTNPNHPKLS